MKHFIHIPKNGGMTIRKAVGGVATTGANLLDPSYHQRYVEAMRKIGAHPGTEHSRWRDIKPEYTANTTCFAIVRNPWDRLVSRYFFAKKVKEVEKKGGLDATYDVRSFDSFIKSEFDKWGDIEFMWNRAIINWYPAFDHVADTNNQVRCDILRFENYEEDVMAYLGRTPARKRNVTNLNPGKYTDVYTPETIQWVADRYEVDISVWGYDFDTGPTKNYWNKQ